MGSGVGRSGLVGRGSLVRGFGLILGVLGLTLVPDISDVARVSILNSVGDDLGAAIGKSNTVFTIGGITITSLVLAKVGSSVVILNSIGILVLGRLIVFGLLVSGAVVRGSVVGQGDGGKSENNEDLFMIDF